MRRHLKQLFHFLHLFLFCILGDKIIFQFESLEQIWKKRTKFKITQEDENYLHGIKFAFIAEPPILANCHIKQWSVNVIWLNIQKNIKVFQSLITTALNWQHCNTNCNACSIVIKPIRWRTSAFWEKVNKSIVYSWNL